MRFWILSARLAGSPAMGLYKQALAAALFGCLLPLGAAAASDDHFVYPEAAREAVTDDYFGAKVSDPYRWIEDLDAPRTQVWIAAQSKLSVPHLAGLPERGSIRDRLARLWSYERFGVPSRSTAGLLLYTRNDGLQNHTVLYARKPGTANARVLLDPNTWSADGTVALAHWTVSPDGLWLLYARQTAGSDWVEYRLLEIETAKELEDRLTGVHFNFDASRIEWRGSSVGFFYSRFPAAAGNDASVGLRNHKLYFHRVGTAQSEDVLIHERLDQPEWFSWAQLTDDGRYLLVLVERTEDTEKELFVKDLGDGAQPKLDAPLRSIRSGFDARYMLVGSVGSRLFLRTSLQAPRYRIVTIDLAGSDPVQLHELVPQSGDVMDSAQLLGGELVLDYLHDAASGLLRYSLGGKKLGEIALPGPGSVYGVSGGANDPEIFLGFTSFSQPFSTYRHHLKTGKTERFAKLRLAFKPEDYVTERLFCRSKDGTRVPLFISYKKGLRKDGRAPALLYGYGGFGISITPSFSVPNLVWMERGGVYASACLRGGNEYGEEWHRDGTLERKQNVFDDFIAAGEFLVHEKFTSPSRLGILGGSNGGLLVGAVTNQRPELFAAAVLSVGVLDMLRYHRLGIGYAWAGDYGTADTPEGFKYLSAYSPYHNIRAGVKYPAVLAMTADHDDRVFPGHTFKYTAALQAAQAADKPILLRVEARAGHGGGTPLSKLIEKAADWLSFLVRYTDPGTGATEGPQ
jgi:prolyl oligopeptidase